MLLITVPEMLSGDLIDDMLGVTQFFEHRKELGQELLLLTGTRSLLDEVSREVVQAREGALCLASIGLLDQIFDDREKCLGEGNLLSLVNALNGLRLEQMEECLALQNDRLIGEIQVCFLGLETVRDRLFLGLSLCIA